MPLPSLTQKHRTMDNNDIFKKLRVALQLRDEQIVEILQLVDFRISKAELGAFFRNTDHPNYVECGDQVLRNFLNGLVIHLRGTKENPKNPGDVIGKNRADATPSDAARFPKDMNTKNAPRDSNAAKRTGGAKPSQSRPKKKPDTKPAKKIQVVEKVKFTLGKNKKS
jgi:hypothetical protein